MTFLLDVNVLIALIDPSHPDHDPADRWFSSLEDPTWATCPITENAILRIVGAPSYRNSPGSLAAVAYLLNKAFAVPGHVFWPDSISLLSQVRLNFDQLHHHNQITDIYLLALAKSQGAQLATFDRRIRPDVIENGKDALFLIPQSI